MDLDITNNEIHELGLFSRMIINFRVIKMAHEGKFNNNSYDISELSRFIYPREINKKIIDNITILQSELSDYSK